MVSGLLWFDNDPKRTLADKVAQAAERHFQKYGQRADTCYVNPASGEACTVGEIRVRTAPNVLRDHLWIGVAAKEVEA